MKIKTLVSGKLDNNTYILCNDENEFILIDAAAELKDIQARTEDMKCLGVFLTHGHFDHFENLEDIINFYNVKCYITEPELEKLYNPKLNYSIVFNKFFTSKLLRENFELHKY